MTEDLLTKEELKNIPHERLAEIAEGLMAGFEEVRRAVAAETAQHEAISQLNDALAKATVANADDADIYREALVKIRGAIEADPGNIRAVVGLVDVTIGGKTQYEEPKDEEPEDDGQAD